MLKVIGCVTQTHDLRLVLLAAIISGMASFTTLHMLSRVQVAIGWPRRAWIVGAAVAFGCGVWTTHFVAMLAFRPGLPTSYGVTGTVISLLLAIGLAVPALALFAGARPRLFTSAAGALLGTAIGSMHYVGMSALQVPAAVHYDVAFVAVSLVIGLGTAIASLEVACRHHQIAAAALLTLAICGLHFVGMTAVWLEPLPIDSAVSAFPAGILAITVAASTLLILLLSLAGSIVDER